MKRKRTIIKIVILAGYLIGLLVYSLSSIFRNSLTDFGLGFCEGFSIFCIGVGFIYISICLAKKRNPFIL